MTVEEFLRAIFGHPVHPLAAYRMWLAERNGGQLFCDWLWERAERGVKLPAYLTIPEFFSAMVFTVRDEAVKHVVSESQCKVGHWVGLRGLPRLRCTVEDGEWAWEVEGIDGEISGLPEIDIAHIWEDGEADWLAEEDGVNEGHSRKAQRLLEDLQRQHGRGSFMQKIVVGGEIVHIPMRTITLPRAWFEGIEDLLWTFAERAEESGVERLRNHG